MPVPDRDIRTFGSPEVEAAAPPSPEGVFVPTEQFNELLLAVDGVVNVLTRLVNGEPVERHYMLHLINWLPQASANTHPKKYAETI